MSNQIDKTFIQTTLNINGKPVMFGRCEQPIAESAELKTFKGTLSLKLRTEHFMKGNRRSRKKTAFAWTKTLGFRVSARKRY